MEHVKTLAQKLREKEGAPLTMTIGLDGFVDEIVHLVDKRQDFANFTRIKTIAEFGARVTKAAGLSTNVEMVTTQTKLGGNGPIYANALMGFGVDMTYIGALGSPDIHPVFKDMAEKCSCAISLCEPGHSDALEFEDGKIIMGKYAHLDRLTWPALKAACGGAEELAEMVSKSDLFGMENWTMIPYMSDIWEGIISEVFPLMKNMAHEERPLAFFDLADPEKRTPEDIRRAMGLISRFEEKFRAVLGLNEKELYHIAAVLGLGDYADLSREAMTELAAKVRDKMDIFCLVAHPVKFACAAVKGGNGFVDGPFCAKPKLTTGAGDNFNAGFSLGLALGLCFMDALALGVCTSGFYVRNARSATYNEVIEFAEAWVRGEV